MMVTCGRDGLKKLCERFGVADPGTVLCLTVDITLQGCALTVERFSGEVNAYGMPIKNEPGTPVEIVRLDGWTLAQSAEICRELFGIGTMNRLKLIASRWMPWQFAVDGFLSMEVIARIFETK